MKAICTSYNKTDKGLVLRNNWVDTLEEQYLEDFLSKFIKDKSELHYQINATKHALRQRGITPIIEGEMDLDNVVIHIRIINYLLSLSYLELV